ncbi:MAG: glycyl-radical enzyme activating protein [Deltaproteobacteria bacterium]|nr:glycyl-radical enzyme activating protein [Deltaproteobacteria bacterium]
MIQNEIKKPLILEIKGNSLDDGPGIRSVVFFKGCPLSCVWCHNPESKKASAEISFDPKVCIDCGSCRDICPKDVLSRDNRFYIDRNKCDLCFLCVNACPSGALDRVGKIMSTEEILKKVLPDKPFFDTSGGGVTLSGGEPTLHMDFTAEVLKSFKQQNIHTLIETCGLFDLNRFMNMIYPYLDAIYYDIKIIDSADHKKFCGVPNEKILDNFRHLYSKAKNDHKTFLPRTPLIPDITDTETNIKSIADFLKNLSITEAALLAYNPLWHEKNDKVGAEDPYKNSKTMTSFSENTVLERCKSIFADAKIST